MSNDLPLESFNPAKAEKMINLDAKVRAENPQLYPNRTLRPGIVEKYAGDMGGGDWTRCLMPIVIDTFGAILDGQHRLPCRPHRRPCSSGKASRAGAAGRVKTVTFATL